ncbi:MAG TPA: DUF134 domain-containing protein [Candidatus Krumholzibacteria bacterium]|nr:DUF134 domain-containing protein [Candidatus Krumholzibacteria bacterium]
MGRPAKPRCCRRYDGDRVYKPQGVPLRELAQDDLPLDAFEALRLCDAEGLDQEQAAARMGVSRGTVQRLLAQARRTVAVALCEHRALRIILTDREDGHACLHSHD